MFFVCLFVLTAHLKTEGHMRESNIVSQVCDSSLGADVSVLQRRLSAQTKTQGLEKKSNLERWEPKCFLKALTLHF